MTGLVKVKSISSKVSIFNRQTKWLFIPLAVATLLLGLTKPARLDRRIAIRLTVRDVLWYVLTICLSDFDYRVGYDL